MTNPNHTHAIQIHQTGGADELRYEQVELAAPRAGEVLIRHTAIGLNYIDVYFRCGLYKAPHMPFTPGMEGAGVIEAVGEGVDCFAIGDRVAYAGGKLGAYAKKRTIDASLLVKLPNTISDEQAASCMVQGLTAEFLVCRTFPVQKGTTCLIHAAAGGVGTLLTQWAKHLGAYVIATVGSEEKAVIARKNGCDEVILYTRENVVERVRELTNGQGVQVVYDSVGKDTFAASLDCLRPMGMMVSFGQSSGAIPPFDILTLSQKGSLFLTRPTMTEYFRDPVDYQEGAKTLFSLIEQGIITIQIGQKYALKDAALSHRDLEARKTQGATVLLP